VTGVSSGQGSVVSVERGELGVSGDVSCGAIWGVSRWQDVGYIQWQAHRLVGLCIGRRRLPSRSLLVYKGSTKHLDYRGHARVNERSAIETLGASSSICWVVREVGRQRRWYACYRLRLVEGCSNDVEDKTSTSTHNFSSLPFGHSLYTFKENETRTFHLCSSAGIRRLCPS
jgi:hypothetical protein